MNLVRAKARLAGHVKLQKSILIFLANNEVAGSRRLLSQALKAGLSEKAILLRLEQAFLGKYNAKGFSDKDFDIAILSLRLGGQALLYSLSKSSGFPGVSTVYKKMRDRKVRLCTFL